jgi:hypothetical protein
MVIHTRYCRPSIRKGRYNDGAAVVSSEGPILQFRQETRQSRYRKRRRAGLVPCCVEVSAEIVEALVISGRLPEAEAADRRAIEAALKEVVADFAARWL